MGPVVICIADHTRARIYAQSARGASLRLVEEIARPQAGWKNTDLVSDRPGVKRQGYSAAAFGGAAHETPKEHEQRKLAHDVAAALEKARMRGDLEELVLVAGPKTLGSIKRQLTSATSKKLAATIESDIAQLDEHDLARHLRHKWFVATPVFAGQSAPIRL
jgi:protein required for attachment to host cells